MMNIVNKLMPQDNIKMKKRNMKILKINKGYKLLHININLIIYLST